MKLLDLFSGGKSVTRVAESLGYTVTTLDINKNYKPDIIANVLDFDYREAFKPGDFDVVWASPPCDTFSKARRSNIGRMVFDELMTNAWRCWREMQKGVYRCTKRYHINN